MELRDLRYFMAIAREGNITAAANSLHLTQPALTRALKALEDEIGTQLFFRDIRPMRLTEEGILLRTRAEEILLLADKAAEEMKTRRSIAGDIYLHAGETAAMHHVLRAMRNVQEQHPEIRLHVVSGDTENVTDALETGIADLGMLYTFYDMSRYEYVEIPFDEQWGVILPKTDPLARCDEIDIQQLRGKPLILSRAVTPQKMRDGLYGLQWNEFRLAGTYSLLFNASLMVEDGLGYALGLNHILHFSEDSPLCFRPIAGGSQRLRSLDHFPNFRINLVWRRDRVMSRAARALVEAVREQAAAASSV